MTHRKIIGAVAALALLLLVASARSASAQGLASLAAVSSGAVSVEKRPGCWGCGTSYGMEYCQGGHVPGNFNCTVVWGDNCRLSSPGCGGSAMLPLDPDGGAQFVSRGSKMGVVVVLMPGDPDVRRNCDGVVVARSQSPDDIAGVRARTGTLTL